MAFAELACSDSLEPPAGLQRELPEVELVPGRSLDSAAPVLHIEVHTSEPFGSEQWPRLYHGALSSYHLGKIRRGDLPATLLEREVMASAFFEAARERWVIAPSVALSTGETYALASADHGLLVELVVAEEPDTKSLSRIFPPAELGGSARYAVFCLSEFVPGVKLLARALDVSLLPSRRAARVAPGVATNLFADRCVHLTSQDEAAPDTLSVLPPEIAGLVLDPAPFVEPVAPEVEPELVCSEEEQRFGPGCASVLDDRLILRSGDARLWILRSNEVSFFQVLEAGRRAVVRGLPPRHLVEVDWFTVDLFGRVREGREQVSTLAPVPHVVINEVLANPVGPEPAQEWIELYNDGTLAVDLGGFALEDIGARSVLPSYVLEPGAFVLVTGEAFDRAASWDVPFPENAVVLQVPALGKSGISNSGEPLRLLSATGRVLSAFPAHKAKAGVSHGRREPCALEDDDGAFADHAAPGASPFAPNRLEPRGDEG